MADSATYKRSLGLIELVSMGIGGTIGSGIFVVPGIAARIMGPASLIAWLIVAVSASAVLLSLATVSQAFGPSGSFYQIFSSLFGENIGNLLILIYLISSVFGIATIAAGIGQYITYFGGMQILAAEIFVLILLCMVNIIGIRLSGMTENILTLIKVAPLIVLSLLLLPLFRPDHFVQLVPVTATGLFAAIIIVYWPFTGFEISAIPVEETKNPAVIRRALLYVMMAVVGIYLLLNIALIGSVGSDVLAASPAPVATAAGLLIADAGPVVAFIGIVAMLSAMNAYIVGTSRILQNIARVNALPFLKKISSRGTPVPALIAGCIISGFLLLVSNHFSQLATISVITTLIPYIFFCISAWILVPERKSRAISAIGAFSTAAILVLYFIV